MAKLTLSIGAFASTNYYQAQLDVINNLQAEDIALWLEQENVEIQIKVSPRVSRRMPNHSLNRVFTAEITWQLSEQLLTAFSLKYWPLPKAKESIGVWQIHPKNQIF